jgi:hypothetical protein
MKLVEVIARQTPALEHIEVAVGSQWMPVSKL